MASDRPLSVTSMLGEVTRRECRIRALFAETKTWHYLNNSCPR